MSAETDRHPQGLIASVRKIFRAAVLHIRLLVELAVSECGDVVEDYIYAIGFLLFAVVSLIFGYLLLMVFTAVLFVHLLGFAWLWVVVLVMAFLHIAATVVCVWQFKKKIVRPVLTRTIAEVRKDLDLLAEGGDKEFFDT